MLKDSENPPALYPEGCEISDMAGQWWIAHTKSRAEKVLAHMLGCWNIPYFLPLIEKITRRRGRKFKALLPLFSGYLFFCGDVDHRSTALTSNKIAQVIEVVDQKRLIRELTQIHRALNSGAPMDPHPNLSAGVRCRVTAGPMVGLEGVVIRKKNMVRLLLEVEILGQAAAVEIDSDLLESLD